MVHLSVCRANIFVQFLLAGCMVEILCPHCEEEIELDDDAYGDSRVLIVMVNSNGRPPEGGIETC